MTCNRIGRPSLQSLEDKNWTIIHPGLNADSHTHYTFYLHQGNTHRGATPAHKFVQEDLVAARQVVGVCTGSHDVASYHFILQTREVSRLQSTPRMRGLYDSL